MAVTLALLRSTQLELLRLYALRIEPYLHLEHPSFNHLPQLCIDELQLVFANPETHLLLFASLELDLAKALQLLDRAHHRGGQVMDIQLHDRRTVALADIFQHDADVQVLTT